MARGKKDKGLQEKVTTNLFQDIKNKINSQYKSNVLQTFQDGDDLSISRISSGILSLDLILGKGSNGYGWPVGRICEIFGPEAGGKSSIVLSTVAEVTKAGGLVAYIDAENALNMEYVERLGVDLEKLYVINPDSAEQGYDLVRTLAETGEIKLIVVDSVPAMTPTNIMEGSFEDKHMDTGAKLNNQFLRTISSILNKNECTLLLVNQIRTKVGIAYGNPEYTPGGRGIPFYASVRVRVARGEVLKNDVGEEYGHIINVKTSKNKTAIPIRTSEFKIVWGEGFDRLYCLLNIGVDKGVISKSGAWYEVLGQRFQGKDALLEWFNSNPEAFNELDKVVTEVLNGEESAS